MCVILENCMHLEQQCGSQPERFYTTDGYFGESTILATTWHPGAFDVPGRVTFNKLYYEPSILLNVLHILAHLILMITIYLVT